MATFKFGRYIDIHWNGYDIQGPADTVFSIPDQLYEEFNGDIAPVEPTLVWIDTNEFQTLQNSVPNYTIAATSPIAIASSTDTAGAVTKTWSLNANYSTSTHDHSGTYQPAGTYVNSVIGTSPASVSTTSGTATVSISSGTNPNGYLMAADGSGGVIFTPASTSGLTSVVGVSPISSAISGGTVSVSIDQSAITGATAATNAQTVRTYVKNTTGTTIAAYKAVYVSGATGDNALISLSTASTEVGSSKTLGITAESIATDAFGYVVESGYLTGIDTTGVSAGSSIWLGNTPGSLVFGAPPAEPSHSVYLGVVIREQQNNGSILVKVQNGYELDELHDVSAASPSDLDILQYKSSSSLWTKASIANAGIAASTHTHAYQPTGTYVNAVIGTSPVTVSTASGTSTVAIVAGSINSTHLSATSVGTSQLINSSVDSTKIADNAVVAAKINAGAVGTVKISSTGASNGWVLKADGAGNASFASITSGSQVYTTTLSGTGTWTVPTNLKEFELFVQSPGGGGGGGGALRLDISVATAGGSFGGAAGASGAWVYFPRFVVASGTTSYSYSLATPGSGGSSADVSQAATVAKTKLAQSGGNGSAASGATTFGTEVSLSAAGGGGGGNASWTATPTNSTGAAASTLTVSAANKISGVVHCSTASTSAVASYTISNVNGGSIVYLNGVQDSANSTNIRIPLAYAYGSNDFTAAAKTGSTLAIIGSVSQSSNTASTVTSYIGTVSTATSSTNEGGWSGEAPGGGGVDAVTAVSAKQGKSSIGVAGCGGAGTAATYTGGGNGVITVVGSPGGSGLALTGGGGGGGGAAHISSGTTSANQTATGYVVTSGAGGNGGTGIIIIRYIL